MDDQASRIGPDPAMTEDLKGAAKRLIIGVVDDDPAVCGSLKFALELEGFAVRTYHSGADRQARRPRLRSRRLGQYAYHSAACPGVAVDHGLRLKSTT
jgi:hypothetical protein